MKFYYSTIRIVPNHLRGEFAIIGYIVCSPTGREICVRIDDSQSYAKALTKDNRSVYDHAMSYLRHIQAKFESGNSAPQIFEWLKSQAREGLNTIRFSPPLPMSAESVESACKITQSLLKVSTQPREFIDKRKATKRIREGLESLGIPKENLGLRASLETSQSKSAVDFAIHNGTVSSLVQCWSFAGTDSDRTTQDVAGWAWGIRSIRKAGGTVQLDNQKSLFVSRDVPVHAVYIPQRGTDDLPPAVSKTFDDSSLDVKASDYGQLDDVCISIATNHPHKSIERPYGMTEVAEIYDLVSNPDLNERDIADFANRLGRKVIVIKYARTLVNRKRGDPKSRAQGIEELKAKLS